MLRHAWMRTCGRFEARRDTLRNARDIFAAHARRTFVSAESDAREKRRQEMHQRMREHGGPSGGSL